MKLQTLTKKEKKWFEDKMHQHFGIILPRCLLISSGREKIRIFTGDFSEHEINVIGGLAKIETIGMPLATLDKQNDFRINFDVCSLFKASKNILELDKEQAREWLRGEDIENKHGREGYIILKFNDLLIGCGKATREKILNFVPKERRTNLV